MLAMFSEELVDEHLIITSSKLQAALMRNVFVVAGICLTLSAVSYSQDKAAVPAQADLDAAELLIKDVFKTDFLKAKTPGDRLVLARKLLSKGIETKDHPAGRYVLFQMSSELAADIGAVGVILDCEDEMTKCFDVSGTQLIHALTRASKVVKPVKPAASDLHQILRIVEQAIDDGDFELATKYLPVAAFVGRNLSPESLKIVTIRISEVEQLKKTFPGVQEAKKTLESTPKDPEASSVVGKYLCFLNGEWEPGLKLLVQGSDANLKSLAEKEIANPNATMEWIALGDAWWDVGQNETGLARAHILTHAVSWYQRARSTSSGLTAAKLDQRQKERDTFIAGTSLANNSLPQGAIAADAPKHAATQGKFTVWTEPHPVVVGQSFEVVIQVHVAPGKKEYNTADLSGVIVGSDAYKQLLRFPTRPATPVVNGIATLKLRVPGANSGVRNSLRLESKSLGDKQTFELK
jgi:hypothetical protein